jgi:hypothetical protein
MVYLSMPSFIALAGYLALGVLFWVLSVDFAETGPTNSSSGNDFLRGVAGLWFLALLAQLLTVPFAAYSLVMAIRTLGLREIRPRVIALFAVCLAGFLPMLAFVIGYVFFSSGP